MIMFSNSLSMHYMESLDFIFPVLQIPPALIESQDELISK